MDLEVFVTPGLGDNSYLLASGDEAVVVDPQRDAWRFLAAADAHGWRIRAVLETHVHNDYVSGAHEIRAATGADLVVPARGRYTFAHRAADEGDEVVIGDLRVVARATPGHTPEHLAWEVRRVEGRESGSDGAVQALFTGGSLLVGSAGRSDLLGADLADGLARDQYRSIQRLAALPDTVRILPTHGAGSFCVSASAADGAITSTLGIERFVNPAVWGIDEDAFVRGHLSGLLAYPEYYRHMAPLNRAGAPVLGSQPPVPALSADTVAACAADGTWIVDIRDRNEFAAAHIPGSINVELADSFAAYVGWVVPFGERIVLVLPEPDATAPGGTDPGDAAITQLLRIGYDRVVGALGGGLDAWRESGRETRRYATASMRELHRERVARGNPVPVLDVRQAEEWRTAPALTDAQRIFIGDLPGRLNELDAGAGSSASEIWVHCATGYRAAVAASLLDRAGIPVRLVASGGGADWAGF
ncbi:MAG: rhodanese-like domain-containing protein [Chloroflexota bacterium]